MTTKVNQIITDAVLNKLESGVIPWSKPWRDNPNASPTNLQSGKAYQGINMLMLDGDSNYFASFKQVSDKGGKVNKGAKSQKVVYWKLTQYKDKNSGKDKTIPFLRYSNVFNLADTTLEEPEPIKLEDHDPIESCEQIVKGYVDKPGLYLDQPSNRAYYRPSNDTVTMPQLGQFKTPDEYYQTLYHELAHSTGHENRLKREITGGKHSQSYAKEELVAELTACFLCKQAGINMEIDNSAAYIQSWLRALKNDNTLVMQASSKANKAFNYITNVK